MDQVTSLPAINSFCCELSGNMGKRKVVAPPTTSFKKGVDIYTDAPLEKETSIADNVCALPEHTEAIQYLTTHPFEYLLDPDPDD
ncbi:uncharacterized protein LOC119981471 isoform X2 [Tripterygium wilfordii]|uniref:uncharacterized protein LOC119981471 isoform X2 n=1 Tax=Tripterygium wilfordii TaxID=458696 RepID=UPI0018F86312|nr:uncharacterized protein LOC119981471 isoform X2 [Tripterygium wilfordii]